MIELCNKCERYGATVPVSSWFYHATCAPVIAPKASKIKTWAQTFLVGFDLPKENRDRIVEMTIDVRKRPVDYAGARKMYIPGNVKL